MLLTVKYVDQQYSEKRLLGLHVKNDCTNAPEDYIYVHFVFYCTFSNFKVSCCLCSELYYSLRGISFMKNCCRFIESQDHFFSEEYELKMKFNFRLVHISIIRLTVNLKLEKIW